MATEAGTCVGVGDTAVVFEVATGLITTPSEVSVKFDAGNVELSPLPVAVLPEELDVLLPLGAETSPRAPLQGKR